MQICNVQAHQALSQSNRPTSSLRFSALVTALATANVNVLDLATVNTQFMHQRFLNETILMLNI